jgi:hypothetical protein
MAEGQPRLAEDVLGIGAASRQRGAGPGERSRIDGLCVRSRHSDDPAHLFSAPFACGRRRAP